MNYKLEWYKNPFTYLLSGILISMFCFMGCAGHRTTETTTYFDPVLEAQVTKTFIDDTWGMWTLTKILKGTLTITTPEGRIITTTVEGYSRRMDAEGIKAVGGAVGEAGKTLIK